MAGKTTATAPSTEENEVYRDPVVTERDARRAARTMRRDETGDVPVVVAPSRPERSRLDAPAVRVAALAVIVVVGVLIAVLMEDSAGWLVGLVVSLISLMLAGALWSQSSAGGRRQR